MKLFQTTDINAVKDRQEYFSVPLQSSLIEKRSEKFLTKFFYYIVVFSTSVVNKEEKD